MLTVDELSIVNLYTGSRLAVIDQLNEALPHIEEPELRRAALSAARKLLDMSDVDFAAMDRAGALNPEPTSSSAQEGESS